MPRVRDLLLRFRPSGSPGPAGPAGVPADRADRLAAELEPVLAALAPTEEQCTAIVEGARRAAAASRAAAAARAESLRASAPARAEAERLRAEAEPPGVAEGPGAPAGSPVAARGPAADARDDTEVLLAALAEHARAVVPQHLARVAAAVEALCAPPGRGPS